MERLKLDSRSENELESFSLYKEDIGVAFGLRDVLRSMLNDQRVNAWVGSILRYSARFISCKKCELHDIVRLSRKFFTICIEFYQKFVIDRWYLPRKEGGRD